MFSRGSSHGISLMFIALEDRRTQVLIFNMKLKKIPHKAHLISKPLSLGLRRVLAVNETFLLQVMFNKVTPHFAHLQ